MTPRLVSARDWAKDLGVSRWTFRRWRAEGRIPAPIEHLSGWPRWTRKVVDRVTREIEDDRAGRYFRKGIARRQALQADGHRQQQGAHGVQLGARGVRHADIRPESVIDRHLHNLEREAR